LAREEDLAALLRGVEVWNERRKQEPGLRPNLKNAVLNDLDLSGADLRQADLSGADLSGAKLVDADLYKAELSRAFLIGANLTGADLLGAILTESDLGGVVLRNANLLGVQLGQARLVEADLTRADLGWVNLSRTDLTGASLREAVLIQAVFHRPVLDDTDFTGALIASTIFAGVDLRRVRGLEKARYRSPSEISLSTFYLSEGQVPAELLRGAEIPVGFLEANEAHFGRSGDYFSCFISYSHDDAAFVRRLYEDLQSHGVQVWLDDHQLLPGDYLYDAIDRGIRRWDKVLLCCSSSSLKSTWVDREVEKALAKEERLRKERGRRVLGLIPLDLDGALFDWKDGKATALTSRFAPDFSAWANDEEQYQRQFQQLLKALRVGDRGRKAPPRSRL